ncbi:hypothetical protein V6N13_140048 [Hibiscus sabdariffa]
MFKFFNSAFSDVVKRSWQEAAPGNPIQRLFTKMKRLKPRLKEMNKMCLGDISNMVKEKHRQLEDLQLHNLMHIDQRDLAKERSVHKELFELEVVELSFYKQMTKV